MEINLQLYSIKDKLPLEDIPENDCIYSHCLVWGIWDEDEPRPYMECIPLDYMKRDGEWVWLYTHNHKPFRSPEKILYWSVKPDFWAQKGMEVKESIAEYVLEEEPVDKEVSDFVASLSEQRMLEIIDQYRWKDPITTPWSVDKVFKYINEHGSVCEESVRYNEDKYPFTCEEFVEAFNFLDHRNNKVSHVRCSFPTEKKYFTYKGREYVTALMIGQGSHLEISNIQNSFYWNEALVYHVPSARDKREHEK